MHFRYPRKMDSCSSRLLLCGLRPQQKERDFAPVHFNLDTAEIISCSFCFKIITMIFGFISTLCTANPHPAASVLLSELQIPAVLCSGVLREQGH